MRLFKARKFTDGVWVELRFDDPDFFKFAGLFQFMLDEEIYNLARAGHGGPCTYGGFHSKKDANKINNYLSHKAKQWKKLKAEQPTETLRYSTTYKP